MKSWWLASTFALAMVTVAWAQDAPSADLLPDVPEAIGVDPLGDENAVERRVDARRYVLGPGDRLLLGLWGDQPRLRPLTVALEGVLLIPEVGEIEVAGRTLADAETLVKRRLAGAYQNVDITLRLLSVRRFKIPVTGQVAKPGVHLARALERVSAAVRRASGFADGASRRRIVITNGGVERAYADLVRFERTGDEDADPILQSGDRIHVPFLEETVTIFGAVNRPGSLELVTGDTLEDLIALAGGLRPNASADSIEVARFVDDGEPPVRMVVSRLDAANFTLEPSDDVFVRGRGEWREREVAMIEGEVRFPGAYPIEPGETTLGDLLAKAGGPTIEASLMHATLTRTSIGEVRDPEFERLKVMPRADMTEEEYEYFKMRAREMRGRMVVDFERAMAGDVDHDIVLVDGDRVDVPPAGAFVSVLGLVSKPGNLELRPGFSVGDYIDLAGGYAERARKGKTRIVRAGTGEWLKPGDVDELQPGDTIWVPEKQDRDFWKIFTTSLTVITQFATLYLLVDRINN